MDKGKMGHVTIVITVLILCAVFFLIVFTSMNRNRPQIVLPDDGAAPGYAQNGEGIGTENQVLRVEVTPETVQDVIATLERPEAYARTIAITTMWSGGSGTVSLDVYTLPELTRMDMLLMDGQTRHTIQTEDTVYIWYNRERAVYTAARGAFDADAEQWIPTYEDLLALDGAQILEAGYDTYWNTDCVYAATAADPDGYAERYWVSVDTGLLIAAERLQNDETVYRMEELSVTIGEPEAARFVLPDGTALYTAEAA